MFLIIVLGLRTDYDLNICYFPGIIQTDNPGIISLCSEYPLFTHVTISVIFDNHTYPLPSSKNSDFIFNIS